MKLMNYWWLLIWLFAGGAFCTWFFPRQKELVMGEIKKRWSMMAALILAAPYVYWAGTRGNGFGDTAMYRKTFLSAPSSIAQIPTYLEEHTKDKGFSVLIIVIKSVIGNSDVLFFLLIAAVQLYCIVYVFRKYSSNYWLSFFMFIVSTDYLSWMHNGMRQFLAVSLIFACFGLMVRKKYFPLICVILLASTIHGTAILMLPVVFIIQGKAWNKKTVFFIVAIVVIMGSIGQFTSILDDMLSETQYSDLVTNEIWTTDDGTSILRVLVYSAPAILSLWGRRYVAEADDPVINICVNASGITMALYFLASVSSGIYIGRLPVYTTF
ncbi:MAG: EpsG family protein [Blautia sp.]